MEGASGGGCAAPIPLGGAYALRLFEASDVAELHALIEANHEDLARWLPWAVGQVEHDTAGFVRGAGEQLSRNDGFQLAIVEASRIAGAIGFPEVDWQRRATRIGYWLDREKQGHGTMTTAARALVGHAFEVWDLNRVEIRAAVENTSSRAIPERLGFREEGTLRSAERVGDRYHDVVVYGMLASEWPEAAPR
jgi:ribosomal-protein-serine acetyltransferase